MKHEFVHCNLHSEYSLLDSSSRVKDIIETVQRKGMEAVALTDSSVMYGGLEFYMKAKSANLKPLLGCEVYVSPYGRQDRSFKGANNLVLLAQNEKGYRNLCKVVSAAWLEGLYNDKPRLDHEVLSQNPEGLIVLSACLAGEIATNLLRDDYAKAKEIASFYKEVYQDNYYLELQDHGNPDQKKIIPQIIKLSRELDIKLVATNDVHYTEREDFVAREILNCIRDGGRLNESMKYRNKESEQYIKSPEEMYQVFHEIPEALKNTLEIAEKCNLILSMGKSILPHFPLPPGHTAETYLQKIAMEGLKKRYKEITPEINKRFLFELDIINKMGFPAYFLIVWDYINSARKRGIQVGPGRGSAAGSLVAYVLGITDIEPTKYNLLFERFLNPERVSMPDIDTDFCIDRRDELIQYVAEKYGSTNVSQIVTLGTLGAKQVLRDVSKVMGFSVGESEQLSKMIPKTLGVKLKDALEDGQELKKAYDANPQIKEVVDLSLKLEGISRHSSIHAAGVVIAKDPLDTLVPLQKTGEGQIIAQYQMSDLEKLGLLKMDFLGLRNLTMISRAMDIIEKTRGFRLNMEEVEVNFDDPKTYELLCSGATIGVFQLESSGMRKLVKDLQPTLFEEITALLALYRPGPLGSGMVKEFVERKHGRRPITYPHPSIEPILKDTYGLILYQEQIMQISQVIGGYTLGQADLLRRAMGKKKLEEMTKQRATFLEGAAKNGIKPELATELFDTMEKFAEYGFNKSHSAAYAVVTYRTAYLKANYPIEYMTALISSVMNNPDKVPIYTSECRRMGIKILQPDVNSSENGFSVYKDSILFGLKAVKGVGENVIASIAENRQDGPYTSLYDFCKKVSSSALNKKALESLIKAGAFDTINKNRNQLLKGLEATYSSAAKRQKSESTGQTSLFGLAGDSEGEAFDEAPDLPPEPPLSDEENLVLEKEVLGLYVSSHPLDKFGSQLERFCTHSTVDIQEITEPVSVTVGGIVQGLRTMLTRKMDTMAFFNIEDLTGAVEIIAYPRSWEKFKDYLQNDMKILIHGKINPKEEQVKVILDSVTPLSAIPYLEISIKEEISMLKLVSMRSLLQEFSGETPVILNYNSTGKEIVTGKDYWINDNKVLIEKLEQIFGSQNINLVGKS